MPDTPAKELILVLGGTRSGKSSWALHYTEQQYSSYLFLATAHVLDEEMAERIRLHHASRGADWQLVEEPIEISDVLKTRCGSVEAVLIDCLTVWLSNVLLEKGDQKIGRYQTDFLETLSAIPQTVVMVSNEVGMGIVPVSPLGRKFRDISGHLNQEMAAVADRVVFLTAGLPMYLKGPPRMGKESEGR